MPLTIHSYALNGLGDILNFQDFFTINDAGCFASATCSIEETCGAGPIVSTEIIDVTSTQFTKVNNVRSGYS